MVIGSSIPIKDVVNTAQATLSSKEFAYFCFINASHLCVKLFTYL
ncbi:hypothetical protein SAMN05444394_2806 [Algoriphagus halophilus]|uniref:Uncharacterized protein n=1 Tax=Algoriphagus halophilus TaxID=226505 RepID=A0A1N6FX58_9BACT|nr:hypothetical protein SAMN05444394_2806 [Algoriphagus halophilus]